MSEVKASVAEPATTTEITSNAAAETAVEEVTNGLEQVDKLAALSKALESQATKSADPAIEESEPVKDAAAEPGEGEAPAKKKRKKKKNKKKKKDGTIAIDTGEKMSLAAAAFVPTGASSSTLPAQFQNTPLPVPSTTAGESTSSNPFEKLNISAKQFVPAVITSDPA